ncbi:putative F-box/kelch-repeat protein At1g12170 [Prosopis cineraria]|uniref:putative F-box/kelch-repeat protein At1g12170 n=1 Tax=Prosopis cineraria TaxID=364024 RepID=UPI0024103C1E|nr:putative F-box/kelch-repeat protein At1g12170 [Prosopis cineraria]XP_054778156.1 putative F-box/kelch-repeat protein At1g12170 [Prosopis cineraria]
MSQVGTNGDDPVLPQDIITNILVRLPVKSLIRFQCVCKPWKNLFKSSSFIAEHLQHSSLQNLCLLLEDFGKYDPFQICLLDREMKVVQVPNDPFTNSMRWCVWTIDSCNGLLCVGMATFPRSLSLLVWNPATRETRPVLRAVNYSEDEYFCVGFGFSPTLDDYKIVKVRVSEIDYLVNQVEVYSLSTGSWREVEFGNLDGVAIHSDGFTTNGAIFWIGLKLGVEEDEDDINFIVSFDIAMELFTLIPTPPSPFSVRTTSFPKYLTAYENKLAVLSDTLSGDSRSSLIHLWVMEEGTGTNRERWSWTKKYTSNPYPDLFLIPITIWRNEIVCNVRSIDQVEDEVENDERKIVMFNLTTNEIKTHDIRKSALGYGIFNHAESLVPIGNIHTE